MSDTQAVRLAKDGRFFVPCELIQGQSWGRILGTDGELGEPVPIGGWQENWSASFESCQKRYRRRHRGQFDDW
jgi:hypothetical protein